jgi:hypothetical protein
LPLSHLSSLLEDHYTNLVKTITKRFLSEEGDISARQAIFYGVSEGVLKGSAYCHDFCYLRLIPMPREDQSSFDSDPIRHEHVKSHAQSLNIVLSQVVVILARLLLISILIYSIVQAFQVNFEAGIKSIKLYRKLSL